MRTAGRLFHYGMLLRFFQKPGETFVHYKAYLKLFAEPDHFEKKPSVDYSSRRVAG